MQAQKKMSKSFWKGQLHTHDNTIISCNARMLTGMVAAEAEFGNKVESLLSSTQDFEYHRKCSVKHSSDKKIAIWYFLDHLRKNLDAKSAIFEIQSNHTSCGSKMVIPNTSSPQLLDDDDAYARLSDHFQSQDIFYELKIPASLKNTVGYFYILSLKNKQCQQPDKYFQDKYSVDIVRNRDMLVGFMVDFKCKQTHGLKSNFISCSPSHLPLYGSSSGPSGSSPTTSGRQVLAEKKNSNQKHKLEEEIENIDAKKMRSCKTEPERRDQKISDENNQNNLDMSAVANSIIKTAKAIKKNNSGVTFSLDTKSGNSTSFETKVSDKFNSLNDQRQQRFLQHFITILNDENKNFVRQLLKNKNEDSNVCELIDLTKD